MNVIKDVRSKTKFLAMTIMGLLIASCSDESSKEALSFPEDMHTNEREIVATAEFDAQVEEQSAAGWARATELFQTETELLTRGQQPVSALSSKATYSRGSRKAYFGDLHVHTAYSFDAYTIGTLATPHDAYRYAKGEAISHPAGFDVQMSRPLDFYAVTDHAMFLGVVEAAADTTTEFSKNEIAKSLHDLNAPENMGAGLFAVLNRIRSFASFLPDAVEQITTGQLDRNQVLDVVRSTWSDTVAAQPPPGTRRFANT